MNRINVYVDDEYEGRQLAGWFDADKAAWIQEPTEWNGNNRVGAVSGLQCGYEGLYRTAAGRWVLVHDSRNEFNGPLARTFITDDRAREWLIEAELDNEIAKYFGELEEERGPGQPPVGPVTNVRFTPEQYAALDAYGAAHGLKRAQVLRNLVDTHLIGAQ